MFWKNDGETKKGKILVIWFWTFIGMIIALISSISVVAHEKKTKRGNVPAIIFIPLLIMVIYGVIAVWVIFFKD